MTITLVVAFLAAPAGAFAQSAGDEQYADPFGSQPPGQKQNDNPPATTPPAESAPAGGGDGTASAAPTAQPAQAESAPAPTATLPRTGGFPTPLLAAMGYALLLAGIVFRRQLR